MFQNPEINEGSGNSAMSKGRILVVEDNMDNYELVRFVLERAGYDVFLAMNGRDGVAAARLQKPDLILMDLSMPEMDGWMAAEKLKADEITKSIPLYALSAHTLPSDRKRALDAGCDGYISKPIHMAGFLDIIESALGGKKKKKPRKSREII
jgi:two-component system cell cycle response regulator DivK